MKSTKNTPEDNSAYTEYYSALISAIENGKNYSQLLDISPNTFGLDEKWPKKDTIIKAVAEVFNLKDMYVAGYPGLRNIAKELESPYSIVISAYEFSKTDFNIES